MRSRTRILAKHAKTNTNEYENENEYEQPRDCSKSFLARRGPETASDEKKRLKSKGSEQSYL